MNVSKKKTLLTEKDIVEIKRKYDSGNYSYKKLMDEYHISNARLVSVLRGNEKPSGYKKYDSSTSLTKRKKDFNLMVDTLIDALQSLK